MNILLAGIPTRSVLEKIRSLYPGNLNVYVAESRPYEMHVARAISACSSRNIRLSVVTDNMLAALIETVPIHAVWSQYLEIDRTYAMAINGAHLAALLARAYGIPCLLHPISGLPPGESGRFAGEDITVPGAAYDTWEPDRVPLELTHEVFENA
jgi:methylthioribose-1-phosphate isomerase